MNADLAYRDLLYWWPEKEFIQRKPAQERTRPAMRHPVPDLPEFPDGFMVITSSNPQAVCQFQVWTVQHDQP